MKTLDQKNAQALLEHGKLTGRERELCERMAARGSLPMNQEIERNERGEIIKYTQSDIECFRSLVLLNITEIDNWRESLSA